MLRFCERVVAYSRGFDLPALRADGMRFDAVLRNLELIGEAATHVPDAMRAVQPDVPWRVIIAMRNRLIHGYLGIDDDTVWSIVSSDVPLLQTRLKQILAAS